jgi:hypothetical protein
VLVQVRNVCAEQAHISELTLCVSLLGINVVIQLPLDFLFLETNGDLVDSAGPWCIVLVTARSCVSYLCCCIHVVMTTSSLHPTTTNHLTLSCKTDTAVENNEEPELVNVSSCWLSMHLVVSLPWRG